MSDLFDVGLLIVVAMIWGSSFTVMKITLNTMSSLEMTVYRTAFAAVFMLFLSLATREKIKIKRQTLLWIALCGLIGVTAPYLLVASGQARTYAGTAALLMGTMPLMTLLLAHFLTRDERLSVGKLIGVGIGALGLFVLLGVEALSDLGTNLGAEALILGGVACYALGTVMLRNLDEVPHAFATCAMMCASLVYLLPIILLSPDATLSHPSSSILLTAVLGFIHTGLAIYMLMIIVKRRGASFASQTNYLIPPFGLLYGAVFLAEPIAFHALLALAIILTGLAITRRTMPPRRQSDDEDPAKPS